MKILRKIIEIDEDLCNGCGQCIPNCAEGAMYIENGKARLKADKLCDGLGACLGHCPTGALKVVEREAEDFDEAAVHAELAREKAGHGGCPGSRVESFARPAPRQVSEPCACSGGAEPSRPAPGAAPASGGAMPCGCPGSNVMNLDRARTAPRQAQEAPVESNLGHWPVKLKLVPANAPFLRGAEVLIAADCAPVALADFNSRLAGKVVLIACPKFDDPVPYLDKLTDMFAHAGIAKATVLRMEVPCCTGLSQLVHHAAEAAGTNVPVEDLIVTRAGEVSPAREQRLARMF